MLHEVAVQAMDPGRLKALIGPERADEFDDIAAAARLLLAGRRVINVNSTATGGGVAELLQTMLSYARGVGVDARWVVIEGDPGFFEITKRIHNHLYGTAGDGGPLGRDQHAHYEQTLARNRDDLCAMVRADDIVLLHDPQVAGLADAVRARGARVVSRCHVGRDSPNECTELGWAFLRPYLEEVDAYVFTRAEFAPPWIERERLHVISPSIDPFSAKNEQLTPRAVREILQFAGLVAGDGVAPAVTFRRRDGSRGCIDRRVNALETGAPPPPDAPLVVQLSRWDRLKDMKGVLHAFARHVDPSFGAHLSLVGPEVDGVSDDPEGTTVLEECLDAWRGLPARERSRVHLACVPMDDPDQAAMIANALQRHAAVVTQKSLAEGFGLTVVEAMWKHRPVVATHVGGIVDQIVDDTQGVLVDDPWDLEEFGRAVSKLLADPDHATRLGENAHQRAHEAFLGDRHLERYATLFATLDERHRSSARPGRGAT